MTITDSLLTPGLAHGRPGAKLKAGKPTGVVIHYVANPGSSAMGNRNFFQNGSGGTGVSAHFVVGLQGEVLRCLPDNEVGYHAGKSYGPQWVESSKIPNSNYIGIECCHPDETGVFNDKTYNATVELTAWLCKQYGIGIDKVFRHYDVCGKNCPMFYVKNPAAWLRMKADISAALAASATEIKAVTPAPTPAPVQAPVLPPVLPPVQAPVQPLAAAEPADTSNNDKIIWNYFKVKGLSDYAVAGLIGNLFAESGLNPQNLQDSFEAKLKMTDLQYTAAVDNGTYTNFVRDSAGYGLAQWTYWSRKENLLNFKNASKTSIGDLWMQLDFLWKELKGYAKVIDGLNTAKSVLEASNVVLLEFEKPADQSAAAQLKRASYGSVYYNKFVRSSPIVQAEQDVSATQSIVQTQTKSETPVNDSPSEWAYPSWYWGRDNGITDGSRPRETASREQVVKMIWNFWTAFLKEV